jgi:prepilin-type N-terminal cleavage/methylation domain-containing protein
MTSHLASPKGLITNSRLRGFTLTELAIVVVIVGFLIGGLLVPLTTQMEVRRIAETQKTMEMARDALLGYAASNGRLPCPARPPDSLPNPPVPTGEESPVGGGTCTNWYNGFLPAVTLGITPTDAQGYAIDAWGNRIRYSVPNVTINTIVNPFTTTNGIRTASITAVAGQTTIYVCASATVVNPGDCGTATKLTDKAPALMFSLGKNAKTAGNDADEAANLNNDLVFVTHDASPSGSATGEFDDIVVYLSLNQLFNRMIMGGALP